MCYTFGLIWLLKIFYFADNSLEKSIISISSTQETEEGEFIIINIIKIVKLLRGRDVAVKNNRALKQKNEISRV